MIVVLGGGLAGLSASYGLTEAGADALTVEKATGLGGLARTFSYRGFRFDAGGHRFLTEKRELESLIENLIGSRLLHVPRKSRIYINDRYFDYPLKPLNAISGLGTGTAIRVIYDYLKQKAGVLLREPRINSLEDWVVHQFGRKIFEIYFRDYTEKVWGLSCNKVSKEWVAQRIQGLSLWDAIKNGVLGIRRAGLRTLTDSFLYPSGGIGEIPERLAAKIRTRNEILTGTDVLEISHDGSFIQKITLANRKGLTDVSGDEYISTIPVTSLLELLNPPPPDDILRTASRLQYRDLVVVTILLNRKQMTDLTWLYFPQREIPFGRLHEPKNWSPEMAPEDKTHLVIEYFCSEGDGTWNRNDKGLIKETSEHLSRLGFFKEDEVMDGVVIRMKNAYPLFDIHYRERINLITEFLGTFRNLHLAGRTGTFSYLNMDHAMESGFQVAERLIGKHTSMDRLHKSLWMSGNPA